MLLWIISSYLTSIKFMNNGNLQNQRKRVSLIPLPSRRIIRRLEAIPTLARLDRASTDLLSSSKRVKISSRPSWNISYHSMSAKSISMLSSHSRCRNLPMLKVCSILPHQFLHPFPQLKIWSLGIGSFILTSRFIGRVEIGSLSLKDG